MNSRDHILELLHGEIDGVNSAKDSALLREIMAADPAIAHEYQELCELRELLKGSKELAPRPHVSARIMNAVRSLASAAAPSESVLVRLRSLRLFPAYTFAAGAALACIILVSLTKSTSIDPRNLFGTAVDRGALEKMRVIQTGSFEADGVRGSVNAERSGHVVLVNVTVESARPAELRISFNNAHLHCRGFVDVDNASAGVVMSESDLRAAIVGEHRFAVLFDAESEQSATVTVEALHGTMSVASTTLETSMAQGNR
jgi:anti-sigma factor RsiW